MEKHEIEEPSSIEHLDDQVKTISPKIELEDPDAHLSPEERQKLVRDVMSMLRPIQYLLLREVDRTEHFCGSSTLD